MTKRSATKITKRVVDAIEAGQTAFDSEIRGFGIRGNSNSKSYVVKTIVRGKQKIFTIGLHGSPWTPDSARVEARRILAEIQAGRDPMAHRRVEPGEHLTIEQLSSRFLERHAEPNKKASSVRTDRKNINNHIVPLIGKLKVSEVSMDDIETFKLDVWKGRSKPKDAKAKAKSQGGGIVVRGGPGVSNRCLTLLSTMFNLAEKWALRPRLSNPVTDVKRFPENPKKRFLNSDEYERLGLALLKAETEPSEGQPAIDAIRLLALTGARLSEILTLKWDHVDTARGLLQLTDSKTGAKPVYLNDEAVAVIDSIARFSGNPFVIVGRKSGTHLVDLQRPWQRIRAQAGLNDVRLHDLRHGFASVLASGGVPLAIIGKLLGHAKSETTQRYAHLANGPVQAAARGAGSAIGSMMTRPGLKP